jgi:hypothetical protein
MVVQLSILFQPGALDSDKDVPNDVLGMVRRCHSGYVVDAIEYSFLFFGVCRSAAYQSVLDWCMCCNVVMLWKQLP